jgi:hypothetical protein
MATARLRNSDPASKLGLPPLAADTPSACRSQSQRTLRLFNRYLFQANAKPPRVGRRS